MKKPTLLMILDGFGLNDNHEANAVYQAKTPNLDRIMKTYPNTYGYASGLQVGLPEGQMGNSEVGHLNMGAGRIVYQELTRITKEINDGDFFKNPELLSAIENVKANNSALHIWGLLSDGGVHSHNSHLYALLKLAKDNNLDKVYVHCFMDGRDTAPTSGKEYIKELKSQMDSIGVGKIATVIGRYYAMDRDNRWERIDEAYLALTQGIGKKAICPYDALVESYDNGVTDEFVKPIIVVDEDDNPIATVKDNDSVIFFNFRPDRARQITRTFCCDDFDGFDRGNRIKTKYICFTEYDLTIPNKEIAFKKVEITNTLGEYISSLGLTQARIAETEKYAHVTFFFNGGVEAPNIGEERILVNSPKVATYDLKPEMSAFEVCDKLCEAITSGKYDLIITNFANPDMVGHTGILDAAIKAVEAVDTCVGKAIDALLSVDGVCFLCADHGNSEQLLDYETGESLTAHTTNPVPFVLINYDERYTLKAGGCLADIAPTLLDCMGIKQPVEMTGKTLVTLK